MLDATLFDTFEYRGVFWLPATPERRQAGILRFGEKEIELELFGTLTEYHESGSPPPPFYPEHILGLTAHDGTPVTLLECIQTSIGGNPAMPTSTLIAKRLLVGGHFASATDLHFRTFDLNLFNLEEWIGHRPFKTSFVPERDDEGNEAYVSRHFQPKPMTFEVPSLVEGTVSIASRWSRGNSDFHQDVRNHVAWLELQTKVERPLQWFFERTWQLQNLFTLLMGRPTFPRRVMFRVPVDLTLGLRGEIHFFYHPVCGKAAEPTRPIEMLTRFPYLGESRFGSVLSKWFQIQELLTDACDLFVGVIYNEQLYLQFQFLGLVQALETFSRRTEHGKYVSDAEYDVIAKALISAIPANTPADLRESLQRGKIRYGNEYALRKRLRLLLDGLESDTAKMITDQPKQFCDDVVASRNYYTHYTSELQLRAFSPDECFRVCLRLRVLLTILLFKQIGIDESLIREMWTRKDNWSQLAIAVRTKYAYFAPQYENRPNDGPAQGCPE
jgi:hypothetical protein